MELSKLECLLSRLGFRCRTLDRRQWVDQDSRTSGSWDAEVQQRGGEWSRAFEHRWPLSDTCS